MILYKIIAIQFLIMSSTIVIFDFSEKSNLQNWKVVDDAVMGGVSSGNFSVNKNGNGVFSGDVSLDNNGGFSSLRYDTNRITFDNQTTFKIRLKGDGKKYQFRVKSNSRDRHSYSFIFSTNGNWQ
jgi:NADH dehydrogenase [ubiquinone] 1 alpha subcomplex assembly factor 1